MKKILMSLLTVAAVGALMTGGVIAYFSDVETSTGNTFTAGTLDLKVDGTDNPNLAHIDISNRQPGDIQWINWTLKNVGSIPGKVSVEFSAITNNENGSNEPEDIAEAKPFTAYGPRTTLGGPVNGELGEYLITALQLSSSVGKYVFDSTGPPDPQPRALNGVGGKTYDFSPWGGVTLAPGGEQAIWLSLRLAKDLKASKGGYVYEIDDNVIQGDSVVFDIIFHLDQVTP